MHQLVMQQKKSTMLAWIKKQSKKKKNKKKGIVLYNVGLIIFILGCIATLFKFVIYPLFLD